MATFAQAFKPQVIGTTIPIKQVVNGAIVPVASKIDDLAPKVAKNSDDVIDALKATIAIEDEVRDAKIIAQAGLDTGNRAISKADDALGKVGQAFGDIASLADRVFNILNFLATLGTAAKMEYIRNELLNLIRTNSADIDVIQNQIQGMISSIAANAKDIDDLQAYVERELMGLAETLSQIRTQNNAILQNTSSLLSGQNSISSQIIQVSNQVDQVDDLVLRGTPTAVCVALNSGCWQPTFTAECPEVDLSSISSSIQEINNKLGIFPYNCQTLQPNDGNYTTISEALQALTCGGAGIKFNLDDNDIQNIKDDITEEISSTEEALKLAVINAIVDNRMILSDFAGVVADDANNLAVFLNEMKKQQLIDYDSLDLKYEETSITVPQDDFAAIVERDITQITQAISEKIADQETAQAEIDTEIETAQTELTEDREDSQATVNIKGLPYVHLLPPTITPTENNS